VQVSWTVIPDQASLGDGAWCWFADPRAVRFSGLHRRTYVGWVARNGDITIAAYDHDSLVRTTAVLAREVQVDDHATPAIQVLPDGHVRVYWSKHAAGDMWYRTSLAPEDVTAWGPLRRVPTNVAGGYAYTYPNPVHLSAEAATYLFWRGGNFNPTFSVQADGQESWTTARNFILRPGERPYVKVASNGTDKIAFAYTDAHPAELDDVDIHYVEYRAAGGESPAGLYTAGGRRVGSLGEPIAPTDGDTVYDPPHKTWIHDVALDAEGRPALVFAAFPTPADHRYVYARWNAGTWEVHEIVAAGASISEDGREPFYSGGITLDHESPDTVYLSRPVDGVHEIEIWRTPDGGATWTSSAVTAASTEKNVRPISPRGLIPFSTDLGVLWMRGAYPRYVDYRTTILATGGSRAPVADATIAPPTGPAPLTVAFAPRGTTDEDGGVVAYAWDFGDGTQGSGVQAAHTYRHAGTYFPRLTATDDAGATDVFVGEVTVGPSLAHHTSPPPHWAS